MSETPFSIKSKLPHTGTTIFSVMSGLAVEYEAINLSQGFPDFDVDPQLIELVHFYMKKGNNQYSPMPGVPQLLMAISEKIQKFYNSGYNAKDEITITAGATQAIFTAISAIINKGDEVIIFEPAYDCYSPVVELNGGIPVYIQLDLPHFKINWNKVKEKINDKTKLIVINNPNNPAGSVLTEEDLNNLISVTTGKNIFILSDEVYEHILFDNHIHHSMALYPELANKSFIIFSFGKTFHATGWKVGYCIAPEYLMNEFRKVHQFNVFCVNTPVQFALADYLKDEINYLKLSGYYMNKRNLFLELIKETNFIAYPCEGTYFQIVDYSKISNEPDFDFAMRMIKDYGVASVPVSAFYKENNFSTT
jgi:methionine transaminase